MNEISYHSIEGGLFSTAEHRINIIQVGVSLTAFPPDGSPSHLCLSTGHTDKLRKALTLSLENNWANIVVLPEISVPAGSLAELMNLSWDLVKSRDIASGGCIVCLPLEHLSLSQFDNLIGDLANLDGFVSGDSSFDSQDTISHLFSHLPPAERCTAFVNVAVLLVFGQSGLDARGFYFLQPKRFPYPGERTPKSGRFLPGKLTYILDIGGIKVITGICFDLIAQPPGEGLFWGDLIREASSRYKGIDYILLPQCNPAPQDNNFQRAVVDLYHNLQFNSQRMRMVSPNVAHLIIQDDFIRAGHSWFVTCPFGSALPSLGIWERTLASVLKDPSTKEVVRDAPSLGNCAQRLRLAAEGEWLLHLSLPPTDYLTMSRGPNVPLTPHTGRIYEWNDYNWREKDKAQFERDCQYSERLPGLTVMTELPQWIQKNLGGKNTYSPAYTEFIGRGVYLPQSERDRVFSLLRSSNDVWIRGDRACGKTVFGLAIAFDWISDRKGRCLFLDLKDHNTVGTQFTDLVAGDIEWFVHTIRKPLMVVVDNIHTEELISLRLLEQIQKFRQSGEQIQALLLGRYPQEQTTERVSLLDNNSLEKFDLMATEEAFICVARRLFQRSGIEFKIDPKLANRWLEKCGGDLAIFATVFDPLNPGMLDQAFISSQVHQRYIIPAQKQPGGLENFLDLCVLSSLDLNTEDAAIWPKSAEVLYPLFVADGTVLRIPMRAGNPRAHCRLFHPSLGDLVFRVDRNFSEEASRKLWLNQALSICHRKPFLLSLIHYRLSAGYGSTVDFSRWRGAIKGEYGLIERAVCHSPFPTMLMLRRPEASLNCQHFRNLLKSEGFDIILESLARTPAHSIVQFLKYLDGQGLKPEREGLLAALLEDEEFKSRLARTPAHFIVQFLKYLDGQGLKPGREGLLAALLEDEEFKSRLARTPAHLIVQFLKYLDGQGLKTGREGLLAALLEDEEFKSRLARTPAGDVVTFLKYLDGQGLKPEREGLLAAPIIVREKFLEIMFSSPIDSQGKLLEYFSRTGYREVAQEMLDKSWGQLDSAEFEQRILLCPPHLVAGFQKILREYKLHLSQGQWDALIRAAIGSSYKPVLPDPDYPQDKLLGMTVVELNEILTKFAESRNRYKMNCIIKSLTADEEKLQLWVKGLPLEDAALLHKMVTGLCLSIPTAVWDLIKVSGDDVDDVCL